MGLEYGQAQTKVNSIKMSIENIFNTIECDIKQHEELLGTQGVTESNMMIYMGIIEQRINELLQIYNYIQQQEKNNEKGLHIQNFNKDNDDDMLNLGMGGTQLIQTHAPMRIEPPSFGEGLSEDDLSDDGSEKPLGIEEFKLRVENSKKNDAKKKKIKPNSRK